MLGSDGVIGILIGVLGKLIGVGGKTPWSYEKLLAAGIGDAYWVYPIGGGGAVNMLKGLMKLVPFCTKDDGSGCA